MPDGTLRDAFLLPRGYWEAKDTDDDLEYEIKKKINLGYPLTNIIFEDTHRADSLSGRAARPGSETRRPCSNWPTLLHAFTTHAEPDIEKFEQAVEEFKARIPELAQGVLEIIAKERKGNTKFIAAFAAFHDAVQALRWTRASPPSRSTRCWCSTCSPSASSAPFSTIRISPAATPSRRRSRK